MNSRHESAKQVREKQLNAWFAVRSHLRGLKAECDAARLLVPASICAKMEGDCDEVIALLQADLSGVPLPIHSRE